MIELSWVGGIKSNKHIAMWILLALIFANIRVISYILKWSEDQAIHLKVKHRETKSAASKYLSGKQWLPQHDNSRKSIDRHGYMLYSSDSDKIYPILFIPVCVYGTKVFCSRRLEKMSERDWWALRRRPSKLDVRVPMHTFIGIIGDFLLQIRMMQTYKRRNIHSGYDNYLLGLNCTHKCGSVPFIWTLNMMDSHTY